MRQLIPPALFLLITLTVFQCNPERIYTTENDASLAFSLDTVYFDTVFTTIGTATHSFKLYNPHKRYLKIDEIALAGGNASVFRINVDGQSGTVFKNYEIAPEDSMYVFVEATLGSNEHPDVLRIQDSITFKVNGNFQDVDLVAWGQDVHILSGAEISDNTIWNDDKPYLIRDYLFIDFDQLLTINEGVRIHMHRDASIYVLGSLHLNGSIDNPIVIQGDRLEEFYADKPGQWNGIFFLVDSTATNGSTNNVINHALIKNGTIGLFVNSPLYESEPVLTISNTEINHMSHDGILAQGSSIHAENLVIGDCGNSCLELIWAGDYSFTHCTFANYWSSFYSNRTSPAVVMANYFITGDDELYPGDITDASFNNCIISGNNLNELIIYETVYGAFDYSFDHCLTKIDTSNEKVEFDIDRDSRFSNIINNEYPKFAIDTVSEFPIYELDSLSPAIDAGFLDYGIEVQRDKNGNVRTLDGKPDLGAFEWQPYIQE